MRRSAWCRPRGSSSVAGRRCPDDNPLFDLTNPQIDFVGLANAFGMPATLASTAEELAEQFSAALNQPGPHLIDATLPPAA
ncbi:thiamine pyrophosphate-dependent enzyme [Micromonospora sp. NPDC005205]|uniref:thiamine pyrophosphate-dependent enzyme n=1 Tax=Micromonospora sp. NPDC005205 TaxID=3156714 RepID=UPI0033BBDDA7